VPGVVVVGSRFGQASIELARSVASVRGLVRAACVRVLWFELW
jgi:hypothetical protein